MSTFIYQESTITERECPVCGQMVELHEDNSAEYHMKRERSDGRLYMCSGTGQRITVGRTRKRTCLKLKELNNVR